MIFFGIHFSTEPETKVVSGVACFVAMETTVVSGVACFVAQSAMEGEGQMAAVLPASDPPR